MFVEKRFILTYFSSGTDNVSRTESIR